jgi:Fe-S cluster assembly scaffold IscU
MERQGFEATYLDVQENGLLDLDVFKAAIRPDTVLASVMFVNNEVGVIQPIAELGEICREKGIIFHVDAAQATGKVDIDLQKLKVDLMSFSAHKTYGPKGIGALYVRRKPRIRLEAQMHGGGHERGFRSGTLATHQIVGMGEAFRLAKEEMVEENKRVGALRDKLLKGLQDIEATYVNGDLTQRVAHNLNISFAYVEGESMIMAIKDLAVSSGSACTSASLEPSYVLRALGRDDELAHSSIRFSIGRFTTEEEIDYAINCCMRKLANCASFRRCGKCTRTASISVPCSGLHTNKNGQEITELRRNNMSYSVKVIDHYENPRNVGSFGKEDDGVGTGMVGAPACGDVMKLQIKVNKSGVIEDAKFKTYGCGSAIASSSLVTEWVKGKTVDQALAIKNTEIAEELALPPVKIHCSILAEDAIKAAVADYKKKHGE